VVWIGTSEEPAPTETLECISLLDAIHRAGTAAPRSFPSCFRLPPSLAPRRVPAAACSAARTASSSSLRRPAPGSLGVRPLGSASCPDPLTSRPSPRRSPGSPSHPHPPREAVEPMQD